MKKKFGEYVRISRGLFGCSSFWRGPNHYLYVRGNGFLLPFSEDCFRFEFLKIQSVAVTRTGAATVYSVLCGIVGLGSGALVAATIAGIDGSPSDAILITLAVLFGLIALACMGVVAVNLVLGPTCAFRVQTSVRSERIRSLSRWREARDALNAIIPEVEMAQRAIETSAQPRPQPQPQPTETEPELSSFAEFPEPPDSAPNAPTEG